MNNLDPIQQHTLSLGNLTTTFQSLQSVKLNSLLDGKNLKYCHLPTQKSQSTNLNDAPVDKGEKTQNQSEAYRGWGNYLSETFYGEWRIRRDELQKILTVFGTTLELVQKDLGKNTNESDLKTLNHAVVKLDVAVNSAREGLKNLQTEFEDTAKTSWKISPSRTAEFAKFIDNFINQTKDQCAKTRGLVEQRFNKVQSPKNQSRDVDSDEKLLDSRMAQSLFISDGPVPMHDLTASMLSIKAKKAEDSISSLLESKIKARREKLETYVKDADSDEDVFDEDSMPYAQRYQS